MGIDPSSVKKKGSPGNQFFPFWKSVNQVTLALVTPTHETLLRVELTI